MLRCIALLLLLAGTAHAVGDDPLTDKCTEAVCGQRWFCGSWSKLCTAMKILADREDCQYQRSPDPDDCVAWIRRHWIPQKPAASR